MNLPGQYRTGNPKLDAVIAKQLQKDEQFHKVMRSLGFEEQKRSKFMVADKDDRTSKDNVVFDSKQELTRYEELKLMQKAHKIAGLEIQKEFVLLDDFESNGEKIKGVKYITDFYYEDLESSRIVVEEWKVKATRTKDYIIKMKFFRSQYPHILFKEMMGDSD